MPFAGPLDVFEHIENDVSFLKKINNLLKPSGGMVLTASAFNFYGLLKIIM